MDPMLQVGIYCPKLRCVCILSLEAAQQLTLTGQLSADPDVLMDPMLQVGDMLSKVGVCILSLEAVQQLALTGQLC